MLKESVSRLTLSNIDLLIIDARYSGLSIFEIDPELIRAEIDEILIRGSAIYGCKLPISDFFAKYLFEETYDLLINGYAEYTIQEVLLALRLNIIVRFKIIVGIDVEYIPFSGETFNVDFLSSVLNGYSSFRNNLNRRIQNLIDGYEL